MREKDRLVTLAGLMVEKEHPLSVKQQNAI